MDWEAYLGALARVAPLAERLAPAEDALVRQESVRQLAMTVAQGYFVLFSQDARHPQLISFTNPVINSATNPDFMYFYAPVDAACAYRLSGSRGSSLFVQVVQNSGMIGLSAEPGPPLAVLDIDGLSLSPAGAFSVLLSREKPPDHDGDWWQLDSRATSLTIRQAAYDWAAETDGRFAIECLDEGQPAGRLSADEIARSLGRIADFADRYLGSLQVMIASLRARPVNTLFLQEWSRFGGLSSQYYYQGRFELEPDEALVVETALPQRARYWGVAVLDELFNALDWVHNQTSLNGHQATVDADGRFRAVLSLSDPGVPNWLDPVGRRRGLLQGRWLEASSGPTPTIRRVKLHDLRRHLPPDTPTVDMRQRNAVLRERARGAQYRRKW